MTGDRRTIVEPPAEWCPVCHTFHDPVVGVKQDNGKLVEQCPQIPANDPRNRFENYPGPC